MTPVKIILCRIMHVVFSLLYNNFKTELVDNGFKMLSQTNQNKL